MVTERKSRRIVVLDAPSNLGLSPPAEGSFPGCYKLGWALREAGLIEGLSVQEAGVVVPPRYEARWKSGDGVRNADGVASFSADLAERMDPFLRGGTFVVFLGGDCSVILGAALALSEMGRYGVAFLDGHSDFRHPGNSEAISAAAGEDLAIITGRGDSRLVNLGGKGPYVLDSDVVAVGMRANDEHLAEMEELGMSVWPVERLRAVGPETASESIAGEVGGTDTDGFWVHLDVDILDPEVIPAVDTPEPGGLDPDELAALVTALAAHPKAMGMDVCILDPDLDPKGIYAKRVANILKPAFQAVA